MIVRDEAHVVAEAIASVAPFVDTYVVVDTGSTDGTQDVVRREFASRGISGEVFERPWRDFGTNRSEALELCGRRAEYVWVLDADDVVVGTPDLSGLTHDSYLLKFRSGSRYWRRQIFRSALHWAYRGVVHEYPVCLDPGADEARLEGDYHVESRHLGSRSRAADKWTRDAALLRAALAADPSDARSAFYLAQSEQCAGDFRAALEANRRRAEMGGFAEEVFWSLLRAGECLEALGEPWEQVLAAYLAAWEARPSRAEPLHRIARRARLDGRWALAELFARRGRELPLPEGELLYVEDDVWRWKLDDELSIAAAWLGRHRESFDLCARLLDVADVPEPDRERILANRAFSAGPVADETARHPAEVVARLARARRSDAPEITLTITSCRRLDLFKRTVDSFLNCCEDIDRIGRFVCVDDGSSDADRRQMEARYPFFTFVFKTPAEKGHARSMNILRETVEGPFWLHLEDDWHFVVRDRYVGRALAILADDAAIGQVLFNRNYAETWADHGIRGGDVRRTAREGLRYRRHVHGPAPAGGPSNAWWPHFSLRPSLMRTEAIKATGTFDEDAGHFELDFARRYADAGRVSAFLDTISALHTGTLTSERGEGRRPNAYDLNGVPQFRRPGPPRPFRVKLLANWTSSAELCSLWSRQSRGGGRWGDVEITHEDRDVDYWAVVNHPAGEGGFRKDRTIVYQMEPPSSVAAWGAWASPDPREFLQVRSHARFPNNVEWHLGATWEELRRGPVEKTRTLSSVTSGKFEEPGHRLRIGFLKHLEAHGVSLDVFGSDNRQGLASFRGSLPPHDKRAGILPYRYTIAAENNRETNYATEKIWDAVLGECLCFYWGCPNLEELLDPDAFIRLPLEDVEESRLIVARAIRDGERERRLPAILREKRRLLDEAQFFPSLARTLHGHRLFESLDVRVVNLDRRRDRWESFREAAREAAGEAFLARCTRTPAVDGRTLVQTPELRHLFRGNDFGDRRGIVACALSHLALWREIARGDRGCLVFEDDARLAEGFTGRLVEFCGGLADASPDFDLAFLGYQLWDRRFDRVFHAGHLPPRAFPMEWEKFLGGCYAYLVSAAGARRLVALADRDGIQVAIDWFMMRYGSELKAFQAYPQIVSAPVVAPGTGADSDIQYDFAPVAL
jgi:GR25 family glycosyltransferase involved in LPS biosynthesis/glycosyltransferase involved in cell wall biosynthesis